MPQNVRNFWIEADIDGREGRLVGGPVRKDGGFSLTVKMRDNGDVSKALTVRGWVSSDGAIKLEVEPHFQGSLLHAGGFLLTSKR